MPENTKSANGAMPANAAIVGNTKPRIVSWFSCGAASAVATKLALAAYQNTHDVIVARCIVRDEHEDNDRFAADCEKWFDTPVVNLINEKYDGSVDEVIRQGRYISGIDGAPCTRLLKKAVRERFQQPRDTHVFGYTYDSEDMDRWDHFLDANNVSAVAPLIDQRITHANCLAMVQNAGITLPIMYGLGYKHNNCKGCVKATGAGYWNKVRDDFPDVFAKRVAQSRALGVRMTRYKDVRIFLDELPRGYGKYQEEPEVQCGAFCEMAENTIASAEAARKANPFL